MLGRARQIRSALHHTVLHIVANSASKAKTEFKGLVLIRFCQDPLCVFVRLKTRISFLHHARLAQMAPSAPVALAQRLQGILNSCCAMHPVALRGQVLAEFLAIEACIAEYQDVSV